MNVDLLISQTQDVGIVTTAKLPSKITAVIIDHETHEISLEFGETMDSLTMNIPVADDIMAFINNRNGLYVIGTDKTHIHEAYHVPMMHVNSDKSDGIGEWK
jgi:hypothetical protein